MKTFSQKALYAAILGASITGFAGSASAVNLNPDGLGGVLIYPYYSARGGNATLMSVVNTTTTVKAVKVRFLEGRNSAEVLDFNLFLSPGDVWTGAIAAVGTTGGAGIATNDTSCTTPKFPAGQVPFSNLAYATNYDQVPADVAALQSLDRTMEGYMEVIEMADIVSNSPLGKDVTHTSGVPTCALTGTDNKVSDNSTYTYQAVGTDGLVRVFGGTAVVAPSGSGLFGNVNIINGAGGVDTGYNAVAMQNFWSSNYLGQIVKSGSSFPNIAGNTSAGANYGSKNSIVVNNGMAYVSNWNNSIDAVSATLMHDSAFGEYAFTTDGSANTDWVVTFPTKRFYVNRTSATDGYKLGMMGNGYGNLTAAAPFNSLWNGNPDAAYRDDLSGAGTSCDPVSFTGRDREETKAAGGTAQFSPSAPGGTASLCYEANVLGFGGKSGVLLASNITGVQSSSAIQNVGITPVPMGKEGGWGTLTFSGVNAALVANTANTVVNFNVLGGMLPVTSTPPTVTYRGLPVTGFVTSGWNFSAANVYSTSWNLNFSRSVQ